MVFSKLSTLRLTRGVTFLNTRIIRKMIKMKQNNESKPRTFKNTPNPIQPAVVAKKTSGDMRDQAYSICRNFLSGSWKSISPSDMVFKTITGGLSNLIYYCSLPETHTPLVGEPGQALLRMYGQIHDGQRDVVESVIFMMLSERKLGPQLYGIFPGGRLEEYIPARALTCEELRVPAISATIARKLASVHSLNVPIKKEPTWLYDTMTTWLANIRASVNVESVEPSSREMAKKLLSYDLEDESQWLWKFLNQVGSPVVFCHNDLQEGNILFPNEMTESADKVVFIDFEFCSYNFRAFDLANHFLEHCYDYSNEDHPYYSVNMDNFPTEKQQIEFIQNYLNGLEENQEEPSSHLSSEEERHHQISTILAEVSCFTLASHFLWTLWAIGHATRSKIRFGYWEYGVDRLQAYFEKKQQLLDKNP